MKSRSDFIKGGSTMTTIQPEGERLRQAVKWISAERLENEEKPFADLVREASTRFNLSPKEESYLISFYREQMDTTP
jgi:hypothetical protein